jgi:hypothetical protein
MAVDAIRLGQTYYTGNSFNPEACEVTHIVGFADLPSHEQRAWTQMERSRGGDATKLTYVGFNSTRKHGSARGGPVWRVLPEDVFKGVAYASLDEIYAARAAEPGPAGLLRCTLPGEAAREGHR